MKQCLVTDASRIPFFQQALKKYQIDIMYVTPQQLLKDYSLENAVSVVVENNELIIVNDIENFKEEIMRISSLFKYKYLQKIIVKMEKLVVNKHLIHNYISIISGIIVNMLLFLCKIIIGMSVNSIAMISDAINNLSDLLTNVIGYVGYHLSLLPADKEHPYGHGRIEYLSSALIAQIVIFFGGSLFLKSIDLIFNPSTIGINDWTYIIILGALILKYGLYIINKYLAIISENVIFDVIAKDSLNDILTSIMLFINYTVFRFWNYNIDAVTGIIFSIIIIKNGILILKDMVDRLIGQKIDSLLYLKIKKIVMNSQYAFSVHDLMLHAYGAFNYYGTIHVEVDANVDIVTLHTEFDAIEKQIQKTLGVHLVIHLDPMIFDEKRSTTYKIVNSLLAMYYLNYDLHDFRFISEYELEFEVALAFQEQNKQEIVEKLLQRELKKLNALYVVTVVFEYH